MATASTFEQVLDALLNATSSGSALEDRLGYKFTASAAGGNVVVTTTDAELNRLGSNVPSARLAGWFIWATVNNEERMVQTITISSGTATITGSGSNFTATSSTTFYLFRFKLADMQAFANDALRELTVECKIPLAHGPDDYDLQDSDTVDSSWTESNANDTVQTTAAEVFAGARSLVVANSSANGYTQSTTMRMGHGTRVFPHFIAKADTGQGEAAVFDNSSNEEAVVNFTQEDWVYGRPGGTGGVTIGAADEGVFWRLRGDGASDSIDWQFAWFVKENSRMFRLPSWADARFRIKAISRAVYNTAGDEANTWLAEDVRFDRLIEREDYYYNDYSADANPHLVFLRNHVDISEPYFIHIECPWSAPYGVSATLSTIATTTLCPLRLLLPYMKKLLGERGGPLFAQFKEAGEKELEARLPQHYDDRDEPRVKVNRMMY